MILTSGAFDGLHAGHILYLEAAKQLCESGEVHVCAVAPDAYIQHAKGRTPYWSQSDRVRTIYAVGVVDAAIAQGTCSIAPLIRDYKPRLFVKGEDWQDRLPEDVWAACHETGTAVAFVQTPGRHVQEARLSDEAALARFEQLVLTQQPASTPWAPVTDYSFEARQQIEGKHPELIRDVFQPARVLDAGCGPGHLVQMLLDLGVSASGFDAHYEHYDMAFDICDAVALTDNFSRNADLVICREVLEHLTLRQIRQAVTNLCALSSRYVYVTTRFAQAPDHLLDVDTSDDLDPTHISMTNQTWLRHLFVLEGFRRRADLEQQLDWMKKGRCLVYERT